jgi:hypothetical protein
MSKRKFVDGGRVWRFLGHSGVVFLSLISGYLLCDRMSWLQPDGNPTTLGWIVILISSLVGTLLAWLLFQRTNNARSDRP